jgi:NAD(P)-dependent dehydrogenase (short-subunit alcohol dehydrogenase family)
MALNPRLTQWHGQCVWLVGASTGIGEATASLLHKQGAQVVVSARSPAALQAFADRHPGAIALPVDVTDRDAMRDATRQVLARTGRIDLAMYCAGHYHAMRAVNFDLDDALRHQQVNYVGALHLLDAVLPTLLRQADAGAPAHLSLVGSVAGYRGLPEALGYGPTKAALINLAEVLYMDLAPRGVAVSLINPGFVATPLTAQNTFHMPALISPATAAEAILKGWAQGRFEIHFPKRFTRLMKLLAHLPYAWSFPLIRRITGA